MNCTFQTQTVNPPSKTPEYNSEALANFLKRITPGVFQYLDEQYGSNAFDDYDVDSSENSSSTIQLMNRLNSLEMSDFKVNNYSIKFVK